MTNNKGKGKAIAGKAPSAKGKLAANDDKTGGARKRNRSVLQFFEDSAYVDDDDDDSDFADDFLEDEFDTVQPMMAEPPKGGHGNLPFVPKEEEIDEEEFDRMMEERYGEISKFASFAGDEFDDKIIEDSLVAGVKDPTVWKVKCTVGRERVSAFCLMQKFANLKALGTTLPLISAFAVDHMKGFVYIEAEKQSDIYEGCKGIPGIYASRVQPVPRNEVPHMFSFKSGSAEISEGMWARIKSGNYKGDLAQVVAFNNTRKKVTVKLVPRIDLQAMAAKFGGGYSRQKTAIPAPRLISSSELEEFRPLIQFRRDRDTGKVFEVLDGLLLKDGYVFKKVSPESLNLWGVVPTEEELLKFGPSENNESKDLEWLAQLYGESKKKQRVIRNDKGGGKGESSSGSGVVNGFELYDLVCFGKKDFGVIVGMDKDDSYKILKENPDGSVAVTVERHEIKSGLFDLKLSAQDQHNKAIVVNDTVRILEGPSKGKQGIVRHIYRGIVFLWDETLEENGGYFTSKSHMCEKVKLTVDDFTGKDGEPGPSVFDDVPSSPRSPLSPKKPWQGKENNREFNRGDNSNNLFSIGQTLRIRIGPLKGYLCRVIALRRTDVTVKLDSQQKVLTVKCEHLSEVQGKSTAVSSSADQDSSSFKPFDILGTEGATGGWMDGVGTSSAGNGWNAGGSSAGNGWNAGGTSAEGNAWSNHSAPSLLKPEPTANDIISEEDAAWVTKSTPKQNSSWGAAVENTGISSDADQTGGWGKGAGSWGEAEHKVGSTTDTWKNKGNDSDGNQPSGWGQGNGAKEGSAWGKMKSGSDVIAEKQDSDWGKASNWNSVSSDAGGSRGSVWGQLIGSTEKKSETDTTTSWGQDGGKSGSADEMKQTSNWGAWKSGSCSGNENKEANWTSKCADAGSSHSNWGNKTNLNSGHAGNQASDVNNENSGSGNSNQTSNWGNKSNWNTNNSSGRAGNENKNSNWTSEHNNAENQDSSWGKKSNLNSGSGDANQSSGWGKKSDWNTNNTSGSAGNENKNSNWSSDRNNADNQDSSWGKKSNWNSGSGDSNQSSILGKFSDWKANNTSSSTGNENKNSNWSSDCNNAENQNSSWGKKSNWNSGSGDFNQNSSWGKKSNLNADNSFGGAGNENKNSNWSSERKDAENQDSSWGKKSNWNSGSGDKDQNSTWGNKTNWNSDNSSGSGGNENKNSNWSSDSSWGKKSNWTSGSGDKSEGNNWKSSNSWSTGNGSGGDNEGLNETSDDGAGGGNWRGGYRGRGGSDRGGFRGRGFRAREGGGFGGRGERGGFGGRGERGGFGGRGGRGRSDGEGFGGRWGSERSFGGRGRGRNDQSGGWNNRRDSGEDGGYSGWKKEGDNAEGWKNSSGSGGWSREGGDKGKQSWSLENADKERPSWDQGGGSNKQWSSWNSRSGASGGSWNSNGSKQMAEGKDGAGWKKSNAVEETNVQGGGWNKGPNSSDQDKGGWKSNSGSGSGTGDQVPKWGQSSAADKGQSSGWGQSGSADKGQSSGWGQSGAAEKGSSGWGQSGAADKGSSGWGQSSAADKGSSDWGQSGTADDRGQSSGWNRPADGAAGSWGKKNDGSNKDGW